MFYAFILLEGGSWFLALIVTVLSLVFTGAMVRIVLDDNDSIIDSIIGVTACVTILLTGPVVVIPALAIVAVIASVCGLVYVGYKAADKVLS